MYQEILERFEKESAASVMAQITLEAAINEEWVDAIFERHRRGQYRKELLFSTVVKLMTPVSLGRYGSLHAAAQDMKDLPVSLTAIYDKISRIEPQVLRAFVEGSAQRLETIVSKLPQKPTLPGWQLRIVDGNHLPASQKRLKIMREEAGAALPGQTLVVYDPDKGLVTDILPIEDAHTQERAAMVGLLGKARSGELWLADRNFCTSTILESWQQAGASFVVREHARHQRLQKEGTWIASQTPLIQQQYITPESQSNIQWRRIEITLEKPTKEGTQTIRLWTNLPEEITATQIAELYRKRWRIEGMFQRLESVLQSEISTFGYPRAALLAFALAIVAYNILSVLKRYIEEAHNNDDDTQGTTQPIEVSTYYLANIIRNTHGGMMIAIPPQIWSSYLNKDPAWISQKLLELARSVRKQSVRTHKRGPKKPKPISHQKSTFSPHFSTAKLLNLAHL